MWNHVILRSFCLCSREVTLVASVFAFLHCLSFFLPSFAWYVANLQWYAGADGWNGVWIPSDVVMKTPRLADCPAIWGAVSSKGGGVGPVNKSFERPGSPLDEDDPVSILGEIIFVKRWSWAWICIFLPGWDWQSHGDCPSQPRLHFPPSYSQTEPLPYRPTSHLTTLSAKLTLWAPYRLNASLNHDYSECQSHSH